MISLEGSSKIRVVVVLFNGCIIDDMYSSMVLIRLLINVILWEVLIDARTVSVSHTRASDVKHFESELDRNVGYWSPSTSSIDWCERNYVVTRYIAEFWNCLSSFSMCLLGGILFVRGLRNKVEHRFLFSSLGFVLVGLGSAYFHGTLTHLGQMADELPMVYSMIVWWFILFKMNEFQKINNEIFAIDMSVLFGIFYAFLWTYVHSLQTFVLIFQAHMSLMVLGGVIKLIFLYRQSHHHVHRLKYFLMVYVTLLVVAFVSWIVDQQLCEELNERSPFNPQLHAWWHVFGAVHCHLGIVCGEAMRLLSIKHQQHQLSKKHFKPEDHIQIVYHFGLPYVDYSHQTNSIRAKTQ